MKKLLIVGFLVLVSLAIVVQTSAISESKKSADASAKAVKKSPTPKDLVYYRNIFSSGSNVGC